MNSAEFRSIALSLPEALEGSHMGHPDFRVGGRIFATLSPEETWAVVKLTPEQQEEYVRDEPDVFQRVQGGWGRRGYTRVQLAPATEAIVRQALVTSWRNTAPKRLTRVLADSGVSS